MSKTQDKMARALERYCIRPSGDCGWSVHNNKYHKPVSWHPTQHQAHTARLDLAIAASKKEGWV